MGWISRDAAQLLTIKRIHSWSTMDPDGSLRDLKGFSTMGEIQRSSQSSFKSISTNISMSSFSSHITSPPPLAIHIILEDPTIPHINLCGTVLGGETAKTGTVLLLVLFSASETLRGLVHAIQHDCSSSLCFYFWNEEIRHLRAWKWAVIQLDYHWRKSKMYMTKNEGLCSISGTIYWC